jgi:hypothetical protein
MPSERLDDWRLVPSPGMLCCHHRLLASHWLLAALPLPHASTLDPPLHAQAPLVDGHASAVSAQLLLEAGPAPVLLRASRLVVGVALGSRCSLTGLYPARLTPESAIRSPSPNDLETSARRPSIFWSQESPGGRRPARRLERKPTAVPTAATHLLSSPRTAPRAIWPTKTADPRERVSSI